VAPGARAIELIVGPLEAEHAEAVKAAARSQAGLEGVRIEVAVEGEKDNPGTTSALVRSAIARNPIALVLTLVHASDPDLARALADARGRGMPVVMIGGAQSGLRSEEGKGGSPEPTGSQAAGPLIHVLPESFATAAESLVAASINNATNAKLIPQAGAVLLINTASDPMVEERVQAFRGALKSAGITAIQEIRFAGDLKAAKSQLLEVLRSNPKPGIVLSTDHIGLTASFQDITDLGDERPYVVAGFSHDDSGANMARAGEFAAVAIFAPERMLRKAISTAASAGRGVKIPDRVGVVIPVHVSPPGSTTAKTYKMRQPGAQRPERR
jgi:ABC-type sugar transport system substrate-binding protein